MSMTRMRQKGQITIPAELRKSLNLQEDTVLSIAKAGGAIVLCPRASRFEPIAREFSKEAAKKGISLGELLRHLRGVRRRKFAA